MIEKEQAVHIATEYIASVGPSDLTYDFAVRRSPKHPSAFEEREAWVVYFVYEAPKIEGHWIAHVDAVTSEVYRCYAM